MWNLIIITAAAIILGIVINSLLSKVPKLKIVFQILLPIAIFALAFFLYKGIETPIEFEKKKAYRYEKVKQNLIDIRSAQNFYKQVNEKYAGNFDALIDFVKNDSLPLVKAIGSLSDSLLEAGWTEKRGIKEGVIIRDTIKISVLDTLFNKSYPIDSLRYIPFGGGAEFEMAESEILTGSNVKVKVFEAKAPFDIWLKGLDHQLIINLIAQRKVNELYYGLKVGSIEEANNNAGNWE
ncbi:MAG: hypothetical protein U9R19_08045 [Bacteroidota bacterium]|nr:hypothetical protein [Bacteroidota bacterium]